MVPPVSTHWKEGIVGKIQNLVRKDPSPLLTDAQPANKVVFCTGGSGTICSGQVRGLVALGANACIVGRNAEKAKRVAAEISRERSGSRVLGIGDVDVRDFEKVSNAVETCVRELGGIDFVM